MGSKPLMIRQLGPLVEAIRQYGQRLFAPPQDTIRGIDPNAWFSPLQPVKPVGPEGTEPRAFQYYSGQNLLWTPRADAEYSSADLQQLASYPLARICIDNVKDTICAIPWEVHVRRRVGESKKDAAKRAEGDKKLVELNSFFEYPDREHNWDEWLRQLLEELLVIDAASVLIRRTFGNQIVELRVIRGEMITRYIDVNGYTPAPPSPAYAQNWFGIPLVNLTTDQLVYRPRNIVPRGTMASQLYGMSPTESLAKEIETGIQRLLFTMAYYTEGSTPGVVQVVPKGIAPAKISEAMEWMNSELAGNLAQRRQWRLIQGFTDDGKDQIVFSKEPLLVDSFDDLHIRKIAFGYGCSPQRLLQMLNRATSEANQEAAEAEGTLPFVKWVKGIIDHIIQRKFGFTDYEWVANPSKELDAKDMGETLKGLSGGAVLTLNEARKKLGEEERPEPEANMLGIVTGSGFVPIAISAQQAQASADAAAALARNPKPKGKEGEGEGEGEGVTARGKPGKPGEKKTKSNGQPVARAEIGFVSAVQPQVGTVLLPFHKAQATIRADWLEPPVNRAMQTMDRLLRDHFKVMFRRTADELTKTVNKIRKVSREDATLKRILKRLAAQWQRIADEALDPLSDAALAGVARGGLQLEITDEGMLAQVDEVARKWASRRAAELVGMRRNAAGKLVPHPDAKWAISDTTRDTLRRIITSVFEQESPTLASIEQAIMQAGIYSDDRATIIARTEISRAQGLGNLEMWKKAGIKWVDWLLSSEHDRDDDCDDAEADSPHKITEILAENPAFPLHPMCMCSLVISEENPEE